jgi:hypothetical protein
LVQVAEIVSTKQSYNTFQLFSLSKASFTYPHRFIPWLRATIPIRKLSKSSSSSAARTTSTASTGTWKTFHLARTGRPICSKNPRLTSIVNWFLSGPRGSYQMLSLLQSSSRLQSEHTGTNFVWPYTLPLPKLACFSTFGSWKLTETVW